MKDGQRLWTREELMLVINLYAKLPFGKMDHRNKDVQDVAKLINRTPGAVARRLANFASLDPVQIARGIKGLPNAGNLAEEVWSEFYKDWDKNFEASEELLAEYKKIRVEDIYKDELLDLEIGIDKERLIKTRLNQYRFRQLVLTNFNYTCCITGIRHPELLIASHITSWSKDHSNRLNPANGLCLNALHDKAFDKGLITVSAKDFSILISPLLKNKKEAEANIYFLKYEGKVITMPKKFAPNPDFLTVHNQFFHERIDTA